MAKDLGSERDPSVRLAFLAIGSIALWLVTFAVANVILAGDPRDVTPRVAAIALAAVGFGPWLWVVVKTIAAQDEFKWRIHVIALSWAFAATGAFVMFADLLVRARFLDYLPLTYIWIFMVISWSVSMMATSRYFR